MITLKVYASSSIDNNLSSARANNESILRHFAMPWSWECYLKTFPHVIDAKWVSPYDDANEEPHTIITFDSEEHKNWFILRWS